MIRTAVGAIVIQREEILLVHKVKMMDSKSGAEDIPGEWDFPKGGVKSSDIDLREAILRELKEETGSEQYKIVKKCDEKIRFTFSQSVQSKIGFIGQETTMFQVEYIGDRSDLQPEDSEIDQVSFFPKSRVLNILYHEDSREFFRRFVE
jgi:putative (di)nucleoside polyphosphate hydrolase